MRTRIEALGDRGILRITMAKDGTSHSHDPEVDALRALSVQIGHMIDRQLAWHGRDRQGPSVPSITPYYWVGALVPYTAAFMDGPRWSWLNKWLVEKCPGWRTTSRQMKYRKKKRKDVNVVITKGRPDTEKFWRDEIKGKQPVELGQTKAVALRAAARVFFRYRTLKRVKTIPASLSRVRASDPDVVADRRPWGAEDHAYIDQLKRYLPSVATFFINFKCTRDLDEASRGATGLEHWMFDLTR